MWIDDGETAVGDEVLERQRFQQRGLADAGLADHIGVRQPISLLDAEAAEPGAGRGLGEEGYVRGALHPTILKYERRTGTASPCAAPDPAKA
jgi:hypothetical protein